MTPNETTQLRTMAELSRRQRHEIARLRECLGLASEESRVFDEENVELFAVVHQNHEKRNCYV